MAAEVVGRLAWFAVFAGLGRARGEAEVGVFVFAAAFVQIGILAFDLGLDRYLIRTVARDRERRHELTSDIVAMKLTLAIPLIVALLAVASLLGYGGETRTTIFVLAIAFVLESLGRTVIALLVSYESGGPIAVTAVIQRVIAAVLGIGALLLGFGVVSVALAYLVGAISGLILGTALMARAIGVPSWIPDRSRWGSHARTSLPFASEDIFTVLLFKIDAVILALMTTEVAVGLYGAAYRIFEATLVVPYALVRAFSAMFVYLERDSEPTIQGTFSRSIKLALAGLIPLAVGFGLLADPLIEVTFGDDFADAAGPLRLLAPAIAMLAVVSLSAAVITSRRDPKIVTYLTAAIMLVNVGLNFVLIPPYEESGAAASMLISESLFSVTALAIAVRTIGGVDWLRMLAGPLAAGAMMAGILVALSSSPLIAVSAGLAAYLAALFVIESVTSPGDVRFALRLVGRLLPGRAAA